MGIRINKYLAQQGYCSRREADELIRAGKVSLNGKEAVLGDAVEEGDDVQVQGRGTPDAQEPLYIMLNKPVGFITTTDRTKKDNVISLLKMRQRIFPVGRLDVLSSGLLILTNDGALANELTHPRYEHEKEYEVTIKNEVSDSLLNKIKGGVMLEEGMTMPAKAEQLSDNVFSITLREGRNRQIRRMCSELDEEILKLRRVRVSTLKLGSLEVGKWRELTQKEVTDLKRSTRRK